MYFFKQSPVHTQDEFFTGTVESVKREDSFLIESPSSIMELGNFNKVPWILGITSEEYYAIDTFKVSSVLFLQA